VELTAIARKRRPIVQLVGYKHKGLIIGEIQGQKFKAPKWDLRKAVLSTSVAVGKDDWDVQKRSEKPVSVCRDDGFVG